MIEFSVVIPLYNKGPHIKRCIDSLKAQTLAPREIIIVDDGSTDGGYEYIENLRDPTIVLMRRTQPGPGGYAARNLAIENAICDWIAFLDADDEWMPQHLATLQQTLEMAENRDVVSVSTGYKNVMAGAPDEPDIYSRSRNSEEPEFLEFGDFLQKWLDLGGSPIWTSATACRKDALKRAGLFPAGRCSRGGDKDLWFRLAALGSVAITPAVSAIYHKDSVNMVTGRKSVNERHCMCATIEAMLPGSSAAVQLLLRKIYNLEVYKYCIRTVKSTQLKASTWKGFHTWEDPSKYLVLATLSSGLVGAVIRFVLGLRSGAARS